MKKVLFLVYFFVFSQTYASDLDLLSTYSDTGFGGYYLDVERTMQKLNVTRLEAHEIQNQMRDEVENLSGSYSRIAQKPYIENALHHAINSVKSGHQQGLFKPLQFKGGDFVVVLDLDETLIGQWFLSNANEGGSRVGIPITARDVALTLTDKDGNSLETPTRSVSGSTFYIRPGVKDFLDSISKLPGYRGAVMFTAKEDKAAWDVYNTWKAMDPDLFNKHVIGFYTRNYLLFDGKPKQPSKDLRMFDPTLEHVFFIDDNEKRILQPELNFLIPKFNAESYIQNRTDSVVTQVHEDMMEFTSYMFTYCSHHVSEPQQTITQCLKSELGTKDSFAEATSMYLSYLANRGTIVDQTLLGTYKIFEPEFTPAMVLEMNEPFPKIEKGVLQEP